MNAIRRMWLLCHNERLKKVRLRNNDIELWAEAWAIRARRRRARHGVNVEAIGRCDRSRILKIRWRRWQRNRRCRGQIEDGMIVL